MRRAAFRSTALALASAGLFLADAAVANVVGSDTQHFNPTTNGLDFVTVQSSETLEPGVFNFGLFVNHAVNSLPYFENSESGENQERLRYSDSVTGLDYNVGVGLLERLDLGLSFPQVIQQKVSTDAFHGEFSQRGGTEIRANAKLRLLGKNDGGLALVTSANFNRIKNNPYIGSGAGPTYNFELAADTEIKGVALGLNAGYRARNPGKPNERFPIEPFGNQLIGSAAASYLLSGVDTKLIVEVFGSRPTQDDLTPEARRRQTSAEALVGVKHDLTTEIALHAGGGTELNHAFASPDWRIYAGINWAVGPLFSKEPSIVRQKPKRKPAPEPVPEPSETLIARDIHFPSGSDEMEDPAVIEGLAGLLGRLKDDPTFTRLEVEGHTDSVGSDESNMQLSERRAETVRLALIQRFKLPAEKVKSKGFGETQPIADNGNYQGRRLNRRVVIKIFKR
jgi:outer membrane protein OmpA-like peptidoglycan-associated protein